MTPHTETIIEPDAIGTEEPAIAAPGTEISLLDIAVLVVQRRWFIVRFVSGAVLLAILVALVLPVQYEAKITLMPPAQNSSLGTTLLGQMGNLGTLGALASLGGLQRPADMYVSLLNSRTVEDSMIQRFNLMAEYRKKRMSDTRKAFERRITVVAGSKDGLIRITLVDRDPKRAAELANGFVEEFRKLSESMAITEAARRRLFFQGELDQAKNDLAAAEDAMRKTQQSTGVLEINSQARALIQTAATLRAQVVAKEVEIASKRSYATDDNPALVLDKQELAALQQQLQQIAGSQHDTGSDIVLSKGRVTEAGEEYIRRLRDLKYHETVYELLAKELEIARLDEAREGEIVQVVDSAVVPDKKSFPPRTLIVLASAVLALLAAVFWIMARQSMARAFELAENRTRLEAIKAYWREKPERR